MMSRWKSQEFVNHARVMEMMQDRKSRTREAIRAALGLKLTPVLVASSLLANAVGKMRKL